MGRHLGFISFDCLELFFDAAKIHDGDEKDNRCDHYGYEHQKMIEFRHLPDCQSDKQAQPHDLDYLIADKEFICFDIGGASLDNVASFGVRMEIIIHILQFFV